MPKKVKTEFTIGDKTTLSDLDKEYIDLWLADTVKNKGRVLPEDFALAAAKLKKNVEIVQAYADKMSPPTLKEPEPKSKVKLSHAQETVRKQMNQPTASDRGSKVTVMSEGTAAMIEELEKKKTPPQQFSTKYEDAIFRGNK